MAGPADGPRTPADAAAGRAGELAPIFVLTALTAVWSWWAWKEGAYFGTVLLPGTIVLCVVGIMVARLAPWPPGVRLSRAAIAALAGLVGLGVWALLSALWSPSPDVAIADGQRVLAYAVAFGLGAWLAVALGPRIGLGLIPLVFAGAVAGIVATGGLLTSDAPREILDGGTLDYPLGYRNAQAAYFAVAVFCAVGLAADRRRAAWLRAAALGTATLSADCFLLAQSRGSALAISLALLVYLLLAPRRLRALCWLLLALLPAIAILPALSALYDAGAHPAEAIDEMRAAGTVAAVTAAAGVLLGAVAARFESRLPGIDREPKAANRRMAIAMAVVAVAGVGAFVAAVGDPVDWAEQRADEFRALGSPDLSEEGSRFVVDLSSDRSDLWRVALDDAADEPLLGVGGGGYQDSYLEARRIAHQQVRDAHGVQFETVAEFGIPGLLMLLTALIAAAIAVVRAARDKPPGSEFAAIAAAAGAYWWAHTSIDWFWPYPSVTAPVLALVGSACAIQVRRGSGSPRFPLRIAVGIGLALLALSTVTPFLSERYVNEAYATWRSDLERAYEQLDRAEGLNPLSDDPLLAEAAIAIEAGDPDRAMSALEEAERKRPEEWVTHYLLAKLQQETATGEARRQIMIAVELNPLDENVRALARRLDVPVPERAERA